MGVRMLEPPHRELMLYICAGDVPMNQRSPKLDGV